MREEWGGRGEWPRGRTAQGRSLGAGRNDSNWFGVVIAVQDGFCNVCAFRVCSLN